MSRVIVESAVKIKDMSSRVCHLKGFSLRSYGKKVEKWRTDLKVSLMQKEATQKRFPRSTTTFSVVGKNELIRWGAPSA